MSNAFDLAFSRVIGHEGGFTDDPRDRGNWTGGQVGKGECKGTKFGISAAAYPLLDIKNLTVEDAKEIYRKDFWEDAELDSCPIALAFQVFDAAINHGMHSAKRMFQRAVGVKDDGRIGPATRDAAFQLWLSGGQHDMLHLFLAERLEYMTNAKTWDTYGEGWARRIAANLRYSATDTIN